MEVNDLWQENKRFIASVASGVIVFVIGSMLINSFFRDELLAQRRSAESAAKKLRADPMYSSEDLVMAQKENSELKRALGTLKSAVDFQPRPEFVFDPARGSASNHYFASVSSVREELLTLAGRGNLRVQEDLGLPALSPTRESEIVRYLEALDLIDRAVRLAIAAGVDRIEKIEIKLDPRLTSREGVGEIERTRVSFALAGHATPIVQFLQESQRAAEASSSGDAHLAAAAAAAADSSKKAPGQLPTSLPRFAPLLIEKVDMRPARAVGSNEAALDVTFVIARSNSA